MALEIANNSPQSSFLILSDSLSCLMSLSQIDILNPIILKLRLKVHALNQLKKNIQFAWIPSHIGIKGNDEADSLAKKTLNSEIDNKQKISHSDYKQYINNITHSQWEKTWEKEKEKRPPNKLSKIKSKLGPRKTLGLKRWDSVIYTRLKLGHTLITHSHLFTKEEKPFCEGCNKYFTVKHILLKCIDFSDIRKKYFKCQTMKVLFDVIEPKTVLNYLKEIGLYNKI